jgi:hypothetical protein
MPRNIGGKPSAEGKAKNSRNNFFCEVRTFNTQDRAVIVSLVKTTITGSKSAYCISPKLGTKATMRRHSTISLLD